MNHRVVITGMGAVTPVGNTVRDMWNNIQKGVCGIGPITAYDASTQKAKLAGEVKINLEDHIPKNELRRMDRYTALAIIAAREALHDSGLSNKPENAHHYGVAISSGIGGIETFAREHSKGLEKGFDRISPFFIPMTISNMAAGIVAIESGFRGYCACPVTACAGGSYAIGDAFRQIRHGYLDAALCGGSEACVTPLAIGGFTAMRALNETDDVTRASIPFDKERNGFILGEGAGCLLLEEFEHAKARGARIYAEIVGYGATCDAYHITAPQPGGEGAAQSMEAALADASLEPCQIDYINAHGTSTPLNDKCEADAILKVFGSHAKHLAVSSTKSMTAHLLGAAGAVEAIITALALKDSFLPPTIHYRVPDPECPLDVVPNQGRSQKIEIALSNSLGFGGHNATLAFVRMAD